jgi:DNA excision repair protein ERCC-5
LKAVRDQQGNSLPQSHIVGFFRRICKLLYFGILPIFVFDGGAPVLKRETINKRKSRRSDNSATKRQTASKLLAIQALRLADGENKRATTANDDENIVYLEDLTKLRASPTPESKRFLKKDEFHLPDLTEFRVSAEDARIMPDGENHADYEDFNTVDGINIDNVDPKSKEFGLLPKSTQYMILSHLRIKSRLRMGYRKDQLEEMFPDSMDFSKFQIQLVQKRNFYTQKLMDVAGMNNDGTTSSRRIASDKDREYVLVKNDDGWTLSLQDNSLGNPIVLDDDGNEVLHLENQIQPQPKTEPVAQTVNVDSESDSDLEDVPMQVEETPEEKHRQEKIIQSLYKEYGTLDTHLEENTMETLPLKATETKIQTNSSNPLEQDVFAVVGSSSRDKESDYNIFEQGQSSEVKIEENLPHKNLQKLDFSFADSMLFGNRESSNNGRFSRQNEHTNTLSEYEHKSGTPNTSGGQMVEERSNKLLEHDNDLHINESKETAVINPTGESSVEFENTDDETEKRTVETEKTAVETERKAVDSEIYEPEDEEPPNNEEIKNKPLNLMPLWFDSTIPSTTFQNPSEVNPLASQNKDDNESGLIPWNEAMEMLEESEPEQDSIDDIQEISRDQVEKAQQNHKKETHPESGQNMIEIDDVTSEKDDLEDAKHRKAHIIDFHFEEDEEDDLVRKLIEEEKDHEQFKSQMRQTYDDVLSSVHTTINDERLLQEKLLKAKRDSDEVDQNMIQDVQELLRRFGIPYITAPMEAEAQCAELLKIGLVDGIITDDSDCFLFGGDKIYKNMFNQKQYVECYFANEIENKLGLSQENLIELALLLGSDYTEGIKGIGPVLAVEILAEFGNLKKFKQWYDEQISIVRTLSTPSKLQKTLLGRIKSGKLLLPDNFPDSVVRDAYVHAEVDKDDTKFQWGIPDLDEIRSFLMYNVKWTQERVDEVMIPLIRDMNRKRTEGTQSTIGEFFPQQYIQSAKEIPLGKRLKSATSKLNKRFKKQ